jgi:hypothetical protein
MPALESDLGLTTFTLGPFRSARELEFTRHLYELHLVIDNTRTRLENNTILPQSLPTYLS